MADLPTKLTFFLSILMASVVYAQNAQIGTITQDLTTYAAYSQQKECAQSCFIYGGGLCTTDVLGVKIQCAQTGLCVKSGWQARNDCYCSAGLISPAQEFLAACVSSKCSVGDVAVDVSIATNIYSRYCAEKGYRAGEPASILVTTTAGTRRSTSRATATAAATSSNSDTGTENGTGSFSNTSGSKSIPTTTIIGIVVGSLAGLAFLAIAIKTFWRLLGPGGSKKPSQQQHQLAPFDKRPLYPTFPDQQEYYPSPGPASEIVPSDSVSMAGGMAPPAPTLVSDMRSPGRW
jgi:hypothetical protein